MTAPRGQPQFQRRGRHLEAAPAEAILSSVPVDLPGHTAVLLASGPLADGQLPPDTTVWLRPAAGRH